MTNHLENHRKVPGKKSYPIPVLCYDKSWFFFLRCGIGWHLHQRRGQQKLKTTHGGRCEKGVAQMISSVFAIKNILGYSTSISEYMIPVRGSLPPPPPPHMVWSQNLRFAAFRMKTLYLQCFLHGALLARSANLQIRWIFATNLPKTCYLQCFGFDIVE